MKMIAQRLRDLADEIDEDDRVTRCCKEPEAITMACSFNLKQCGGDFAYLTIWHQGEKIGGQQIETGGWGMEKGYRITSHSALLKIEKLK